VQVSGIVCKFVEQPFDTIKVRVQAGTKVMSPSGVMVPEFNGPWDCFVKTLRREGFTALYKVARPCHHFTLSSSAQTQSAACAVVRVRVRWCVCAVNAGSAESDDRVGDGGGVDVCGLQRGQGGPDGPRDPPRQPSTRLSRWQHRR
jgi:hypothetical protein